MYVKSGRNRNIYIFWFLLTLFKNIIPDKKVDPKLTSRKGTVRLQSIVLVKLAYYASSTARFLSKLCLKLCSFFKITLLFFNIMLDKKMGLDDSLLS